MRILVTGHRGHVGAPVARQPTESGFDVAGFDRANGQDVLDPGQLPPSSAGGPATAGLAVASPEYLA